MDDLIAELIAFIKARLEEESETALALSELGEQLGARDAESAAAVRARVAEDKTVALTLVELAEYLGEDLRPMASLWKNHADYQQEWAPS
jgi:hypothetical protein